MHRVGPGREGLSRDRRVTIGLRQEIHDRLWGAFQRWQELRATGITKRDLKLRGLREAHDPNRYTRPLLFARETARSYEGVLKDFVEMAEREFGITRLDDLGKREFRAFMDRAIERGLSAKTLQRMSSALVKGGCLIGRSASYIALGERYARKIRELLASGVIDGPDRETPSPEVARRAIDLLREWDACHFKHTDAPRAYHLVARLQLETACRSISATTRATAESLREDNAIMLSAKGGRLERFVLSPELHRLLSAYLRTYGGRLADQDGYRMAYKRAIEAAGGRVTGTHGLRRLSAQEFYLGRYRAAVGDGLSPAAAADRAAGDAIERLGHSRNRADHRRAYLGH